MEKSRRRTDWERGLKPEGIVTIGDPILRSPTALVTDLRAASEIVKEMVAMLRELSGAGLAAPQIGIPLRLAIVEIRRNEQHPNRPESPLHIFVNPVIAPVGSETAEDWEGCFSIPGLMGKVRRPVAIDLRYQELSGEHKTGRFDGYLARVIQHECDHLDGVLFLDRISDPSSLTTIENYSRFHLR